MRHSSTQPCECEHISHLDRDERSPNGNPNHSYGVKFFETHAIKTPYGTFHVCTDCKKDCYAQFVGVK